MSQAVLTWLINLSIKCLKVYKHSLVAMGAHSERPIEILTSAKSVDRWTTRKFGLFSSSEASFQHCKCILVYSRG